MSTTLFDAFKDVSAKQWKQKIQVDLKGEDYSDTLVWKTREGIDVRPFYHLDDFEGFSVSKPQASNFKICQSIFVQDEEKVNQKAINGIKNGVESIYFTIPSNEISLSNLLKSIDLNTNEVHINCQFLDLKFIQDNTTIFSNNNVYHHTDIVGNLAKSGNWYNNLKADFNTLKNSLTHSNTLSVNMALYQNAGANTVQQLAYGLAHANEYLNYLDEQKFRITFNFSVGTNYFFEIAKLKALRLLWETLATEYKTNTKCHIFAIPTKRNKTIYDYNTNMLRTTTECMSAILGEANTICNLPYDAIYHKDNEFGERIARNQLLILKHESYFDAVKNPSEGSYYIEILTKQLAEKALQLFKNIEINGGFLKQLKQGIIQRKIKESAALEQSQFDAKEIHILGSNLHENVNDRMKDELEIYPFVKTKKRKTVIQPIIEKRLTETYEQNRLLTE